MWKKLAVFILRNRLFIISIISIITIFLGYYAITGLKIDNKYGNTLPKEAEAQIAYQKFKKQFGEDGSTLVIAIKTDSLYTERNFTKWKELGDSIRQFQGVQGVISEAELFLLKNIKDQEKFEVERVYDRTFKTKSIEEQKELIRKNPLYKGLLFNDTSNVSLMMINLDETFLEDRGKSQFVLEIEELAETYSPYFGKIHFAGLPHIRVIVAKRIMSEMFIFVGLAIFVASLILYILYRSFRIVMLCNLIVFIAVVWSLGTIALFNFHISIMMALIPPLMIVIGIPNCVYLVTRYHQEYVKRGNKIQALVTMVTKIGAATFLTNLTTAIGFCAFTSSEKLMEFGIIASLNIMLIFATSIALVPIVCSYQNAPRKKHLKHLYRIYSQGFIEVIVNVVVYHRKKVYVASLILVAFSIWGMTKMYATGNITGDLPDDDPIKMDVKFVEKNFGGTIPFEILIDYKSKARLMNNETLEKVDAIQQYVSADTMYSKSLSYVDMIKVINMSYYDNNPDEYRIISNRDKLRLKKYVNNFDLSNVNSGQVSLKELVDTSTTTIRVRTQMKDIGSYEVAGKKDSVIRQMDEILNPEKVNFERMYASYSKGNTKALDSLLEYPAIYNNLTKIISNGNSDLQVLFDSDDTEIYKYANKPGFKEKVRKAIDDEYFDLTLTGISVVASEGTQYLFTGLVESLIVAILSITVLMAFLFRSWRIILISMIPNIIPLLFTAGIMGFFGIPLKPSTLIVFSVALGITVDNAIIFLAKYRQELKTKNWDLKFSIIHTLRETGLGIFYTSVIIFFGFLMFAFSQFGGTKALGMLVSLTVMVGMVTNLIILPSLLLTVERFATTKSFQEPYFDIYDEEEDIDFDSLKIEDLYQSEENTDSSKG